MSLLNSNTDQFDYSSERLCKTCGNEFSGRYCNRCGEEVVERRDKSVGAFFRQQFDRLTFNENKLLRTLKLMFAQPGQLSLNIMNGIRVPFIKPVSIFFLANLLYFLFPVFSTYNSQLRTQMHFLPHSDFAAEMVRTKIANENMTMSDFTLRYQQQSSNISKLLLVVFAILVAVPLMLLNYHQHYYYRDHLLVSFEYNSLSILVCQLAIPWFLIFLEKVFSLTALVEFFFNDVVISVVIGGLSLLVFFIIEKRVYNQPKRAALLRASLMVLSLFICLQIYRGILFLVTMLTL